ncbi:PH domain-containing protein [Planomicrobium sp. CPCC 101079]|uniref:PH domain-containing protein n=1 Tax=Planomicrobium sp. CPCC 101079 TaxID=2599618 RepID=UPI0011B74F55|nr:PH domain-containing protein [Planomicrobium sp. CPCC 101079]TWT13216.1 PH domain-containing protein [Planomicrobium sp. CPCC 101079]
MYINIEEPTKKISPDAIRIWRMTNAIIEGIVLLVIGGLLFSGYYFDWKEWIVWIFWGLLSLSIFATVYSVWFEPAITQRTWRYEIDEDYIQLKYGRFEKHHKLIPMAKVEYVSTNQGPFLRKYDLYDLTIGTVTSSHKIPAIPREEAIALRAKIGFLAKLKDSDEEMDAAADDN